MKIDGNWVVMIFPDEKIVVVRKKPTAYIVYTDKFKTSKEAIYRGKEYIRNFPFFALAIKFKGEMKCKIVELGEFCDLKLGKIIKLKF